MTAGDLGSRIKAARLFRAQREGATKTAVEVREELVVRNFPPVETAFS